MSFVDESVAVPVSVVPDSASSSMLDGNTEISIK